MGERGVRPAGRLRPVPSSPRLRSAGAPVRTLGGSEFFLPQTAMLSNYRITIYTEREGFALRAASAPSILAYARRGLRFEPRRFGVFTSSNRHVIELPDYYLYGERGVRPVGRLRPLLPRLRSAGTPVRTPAVRSFFSSNRPVIELPDCYLYGERGVRTLGTLSSTHAFQACTFDHSDISPKET